MATKRKRAVIAGGLTVFVAIVAWLVYPTYPTRLSLCELIQTRGQDADRWASPHRGATLILRGTLVGGPDGMYAFRTECNGSRVYAALQISPFAVASLSSRHTLGLLSNSDWRREDKSASATILARVSSEVQSCFGPGLVLEALGASVREPVRRTAIAKAN